MAKLETALDLHSGNGKTFMQVWDDSLEMDQWLAERGYADCLAAVEAGVSLPDELADTIRERASYDVGDRAWKRIMQALSSDFPLDEATQRQLDADLAALPWNAAGRR
jgi:hypothetical protein